MGAVERPATQIGGMGLRRLHSGVVLPEQIDQLGHMNVRYYGVRAMAASHALVQELGLAAGAGSDTRLAFTDLFTRFFREQLEGAPLEVWGGVLDVSEKRLRLYQQLINADTDELAASFVHVLELQDRGTRETRPFPPGALDTARDASTEWPEHGRPRTIDLDREPAQLTLEDVRARGLEAREPRTIEPDECGDDGYFRSSNFFNLVWGRDQDDEDDWLEDTEDGGKFGWASLESRGTLYRLPRAGDPIQSFGAVVEIGRKTRHEKFWVFDRNRGDVLCTAQIVNACFDVGARKAILIPEKQIDELNKHFHPDLL